MKSYSLWINKKKQPKIFEKSIKYKKNNKTVLVKTIYSGISKGTEKLVLLKLISKDQFDLMKAPFQEGTFNLPIKYGYINIGKIIDGPKKMLNKNIFSLFPHQSLYEIPIKNISILPNSNLKKFILIANMETAINIFWDSKPKKKDKIIIIGLGSVGLLTAFYFKLRKFNHVYVYDSNIKKKNISKYLNLKFIDFYKIKSADIVIVALGKPAFLTGDMIKEGATVIDVGITRVPDDSKKSGFRIQGDADFDSCAEKASFINLSISFKSIAILIFHIIR